MLAIIIIIIIIIIIGYENHSIQSQSFNSMVRPEIRYSITRGYVEQLSMTATQQFPSQVCTH